jgi:RNA-binding protein YlmH
VARQLRKKFEPFMTKKTDNNQLLLHTLTKLAHDRAVYEKILRGIEDAERVEVAIPVEMFEHEVRDFGIATINEFYKSPAFAKEYSLEGRHIKTTTKI